MKLLKLLPAAALLILPFAAPATVYAAGATTTTPPVTTANTGLYVSGDVVNSGVCQVVGQFRPGEKMVFRAQILETDGSPVDTSTTSATITLAGGQTIPMQYDPGAKLWVGVYPVPLTQKPGPMPYTISAKDSTGHTGLFVPLGMPPMIVNGTVTINFNGNALGSFQEMGATVSLYPIIQMLKKAGFQVGWDGKTVSVTSSAIPTDKLPPAEGEGPYSLVMNGKTVFKTTGQVVKNAEGYDTTYLSADTIGFLVEFFGHGNPQAASFTGYEFNVNTQAAASASAGN